MQDKGENYPNVMKIINLYITESQQTPCKDKCTDKIVIIQGLFYLLTVKIYILQEIELCSCEGT